MSASSLSVVLNDLGLNNPDASEGGERPDSCLFLIRLPLEIRQKIYRLLFIRPVPIMPGPIHFREAVDSYAQDPDEIPENLRYTVKTAFSYQWNITYDLLQKDDEQNNLPRYGGRAGPKTDVTILAKPTMEQQIQIERNNTVMGPFLFGPSLVERLEEYWDEDLQANVTPVVYRRGIYRTQIIKAARIDLPGIFGTQILRTCKEIHDEAVQFLYGNKFAFDFRAQSESGYPWKQHLRQQAMIGVPFAGINVNRSPFGEMILVSPGVLLSTTQFFDRGLFKSRTSGEQYLIEPLAQFFNEIGHRNTQRITSVELQGFLDSSIPVFPAAPLMVQCGDFGEVLELSCKALRKLCPSLHELIIHAAGRKEHKIKLAQGSSHPEVVFRPWSPLRVVDALVTSAWCIMELESLHLTHGHFRSVPSQQVVKLWGPAIDLEKRVEDEHKKRQKNKGLGTVDEKDGPAANAYLAGRL